MQLLVRLHGFSERERALEVAPPVTPLAILRALGVRRDLVLVFSDGVPVADDAALPEGAEIRVVRIVTGGAGGIGASCGSCPRGE